MKLENIVTNALIAVVISTFAVFAGFALQDDVTVDTDAIAKLAAEKIDVPEAVRGARGYAGVAGPIGLAGVAGPIGLAGPAGIAGVDGIDGKDAVIDIDDLADLVADELEDRVNAYSKVFSGGAGNITKSFGVGANNSGYYTFSLTHFGSGDFIVSLEEVGGATTILLDTEGHVDTSHTGIYLDENEAYKLHVSADGSWRTEIE